MIQPQCNNVELSAKGSHLVRPPGRPAFLGLTPPLPFPTNEDGSFTCILAGYCRLERNGESIITDCQAQAFSAGLKLATEIRAVTGQLPPISVGFDHRGIFQKQFLSDNVTGRQKRHPRLSHLHPAIVKVFEPAANQMSVPLKNIFVIPEDSARTRITNALLAIDLPDELRNRLIIGPEGTVGLIASTCSIDSSCSGANGNRPKATCAAIAVEDFRRSAREKDLPQARTLLEVFIEENPWCQLATYVRAVQLTHLLGLTFSLRLNAVGSTGAVCSGEIASQRTSENVWCTEDSQCA